MGRRAYIAVLACLCLPVAGCSSGHVHESPGDPVSSMRPTQVRLPDPCGTLDGAIANGLVGTDRGVVEKKFDRSQAVTSARCVWDGGSFKDSSRKQGSVAADIMVELLQVPGAQEYSTATAAYKSIVGGKTCTSIALAGGDACWYSGTAPSFSVVVRKGYVVVWVTSTATGSADARSARVPATTSRIAGSVAEKID